MAEKFDIVVIGGGPGGARAARRCSQKGAKAAIIEKEYIGGVCLNWGCIPTKTLLASAHTLLKAKHAGELGINVADAKPDWEKIQQRAKKIIENFRNGMSLTMKNNKVAVITGHAVAVSPKQLLVETQNGKIELQTGKLIIATGSEPVQIPAFPFDGSTIISSKEALFLPEIPKSLLIIGGGFIGCEIGCFYAAIGCRVTIVEALDRILPREDDWVSKLLVREFKKLNIDVLTGQKVASVEKQNGFAKINLESGKTIEAEKVMVSVGRKANCDKETINALKLEMNGSAIKVNNKFETNVPGVYAVGDCIGTTFLAHGATTEAEIAAANTTGGNEKMYDYNLIPRVVFTFPEVASVGKSQEQCRADGLDVAVGRAFFRADGRSVTQNETAGEVRAICDRTSQKIVGITMVGANVTEFAALARTLIGTQEKISGICFPHPTVSEAVQEAIEDALGKN
jgi:dihydrolipoamide dehydrogenase